MTRETCVAWQGPKGLTTQQKQADGDKRLACWDGSGVERCDQPEHSIFPEYEMPEDGNCTWQNTRRAVSGKSSLSDFLWYPC